MSQIDPAEGQERQNEQVPPLPPRPVQKKPGWSPLVSGLGLLAVTGGALVAIAVAGTVPLSGASRSCSLKWEERDRQVAAATAEQDTAPPAVQMDSHGR